MLLVAIKKTNIQCLNIDLIKSGKIFVKNTKQNAKSLKSIHRILGESVTQNTHLTTFALE